MILTQKLKHQFYIKIKTGNHLESKALSLSLTKAMHLSPTVGFLLYLEYLKNIFKKTNVEE